MSQVGFVGTLSGEGPRIRLILRKAGFTSGAAPRTLQTHHQKCSLSDLSYSFDRNHLERGQGEATVMKQCGIYIQWTIL